jgi:RNA polymerase sigma-70 factor (ECF subfamily)
MRHASPVESDVPERHFGDTAGAALGPDHDVLGLVRCDDLAAALRLLMQRHGPGIYRYCREALADPALAEDVQQMVFIEAYRDLPRFAGHSSVRTWLFAIARHRVLDAAKSRRAQAQRIGGEREERSELHELPDPQPSPADSIHDQQLRQALIASVGTLDDRSREAVLLRYQHGFSFQEIAEMVGEKPGAIHARVMRSLPKLRRAIESRVGSI